jgi:tetratricopeptide (TPR) repeat protein
MFAGHPLFGIGTGNWFAKYQEYNDPNRDDAYFLESSDINPHNDFLKILSENGLIGFLFFIIIIIYTLIKLIQLSTEKIIYIPIFLSFAGLLVFSFFAFTLENVSTVIILFTAIGLTLNSDVKHNHFIKNKYSNLLLFIGIGIVLIIISVYNFKRYESEKIYLSAMFDKASNNYSLMISELESIDPVYYPVDANKVPVKYYEGTGYFELKEYKKSLECYRDCLKITPLWPPLISNYASALYMTGDHVKSDSLFSVVIKNSPYYIEPKINLLVIHVNNGEDSLALEMIKEIDNLKFDIKGVKNFPIFMKIKDLYEKKYN